MPCGYRDQRRQGHRCLHCREHHRKCNGRRPCGPCVSRNLNCEAHASSRSKVIIVEYDPHKSKQSVTRVLKNETWLYVRIFFDAIDASDSLLLSAFSFGHIGQLVQDNGFVFDAVATVGATYSHQMPTSTPFSPLQLKDLANHCFDFRQQIATEINAPGFSRDPSLLLRAQLLGFLELMTDDTGNRWDQLVDQIRNCFSLEDNMPSPWKDLNPPLLSVTRLVIAIRNLLPSDDPLCTGCTAHPTKAPNSCPLVYGPLTELLLSPGEKMEFLARILEGWACLKNMSLEWLKSTEDAEERSICPSSISLPSHCHLSKQSMQGLEIICLACELQQEIISTVLARSTEPLPGQGRDFMDPFYYWILTDLAHIFSKPEWRSHDWNVPVMNAALINEQALMALDGAERLVERGGLDAILYAAMSLVIGAEISSAKDRERMMRLLRNVKDKGFACASAFEVHLLAEWSNAQLC